MPAHVDAVPGCMLTVHMVVAKGGGSVRNVVLFHPSLNIKKETKSRPTVFPQLEALRLYRPMPYATLLL